MNELVARNGPHVRHLQHKADSVLREVAHAQPPCLQVLLFGVTGSHMHKVVINVGCEQEKTSYY